MAFVELRARARPVCRPAGRGLRCTGLGRATAQARACSTWPAACCCTKASAAPSRLRSSLPLICGCLPRQTCIQRPAGLPHACSTCLVQQPTPSWTGRILTTCTALPEPLPPVTLRFLCASRHRSPPCWQLWKRLAFLVLRPCRMPFGKTLPAPVCWPCWAVVAVLRIFLRMRQMMKMRENVHRTKPMPCRKNGTQLAVCPRQKPCRAGWRPDRGRGNCLLAATAGGNCAVPGSNAEIGQPFLSSWPGCARQSLCAKRPNVCRF